MKLTKADEQLFHDLEAQWKGQAAKFEETIDYIRVYMDHCKQVISAKHEDYFVYVLDNNEAYEGFLHINRDQIKRLPGYTLRVLEIHLAPAYDFEGISPESMSKIVAGIVTELLRLSEEDLLANNIKIYLGPLDKTFVSAFAQYFSHPAIESAEIQGAWLVIRKNVT